jgi:hypothetical protein
MSMRLPFHSNLRRSALDAASCTPTRGNKSTAYSTPREQRNTEKVVITIATTSRPGFFSASLNSEILLESSRQPMCDAARALHRRGFSDDILMVSFWEDSKHQSMRGLVGDWRRLRVREDTRTSPRFASYEPFAAARVSKKTAKSVNKLERGQQVELTKLSRYRAHARG